MTKENSIKSLALWFQILSILGLVLIPLIVYRTMNEIPDPSSQPVIVGSIFIVICLLGTIVGVRPSSMSRSAFRKSKQKEYDDSKESELLHKKPALRGHHYSCQPFTNHVLEIGNNIFCAGCTGLATGATIAILGSMLYFFLGILLIDEFLLFWVGVTGVFLGLIQHHLYRSLPIESGFLRFVVNVFFVLGALFLLIGANKIIGNFSVDLYILCVILLWILNRVMMSKSEHEKICLNCGDESCIRHFS